MSVVLVTGLGAATGSRAAAAALACAGSEPDRAGLLVELSDEGRAPRPSLVAGAAARELEERLAAHLPEAGVASRGGICHLTLAADAEGVERVAAALPSVRDSAAAIHLPPRLLQPALEAPAIRPTAALLRADLGRDRALTALVAADLIRGGLRVSVQKHPLGWLTARRALLGALPAGSGGLRIRIVERLLGDADDQVSRPCYGRRHDSEAEPA